MSRLFTFGCSFTQYYWPTWADILAQDYKESYNWGKIGTGNKFIYQSIIECHQRNCITADDTVAIMYTSTNREDRYISGEWLDYGNVYNGLYTDEHIENFADEDGYLMDTCTFVKGINLLLDDLKCDTHQLSMVPFNKEPNPITDLYTNSLDKVHPSMFDSIFNNKWKYGCYSPNVYASRLRLNYNKCRADGWPTFDEFFNNTNVYCKDNLDTVVQDIENEFNFISQRDRLITSADVDMHPLPLDHLAYINFCNIDVSDQAKVFAEKWHKQVTEGSCNWLMPDIDRF